MEAWYELADVYLSKQNYEKAQFCYEEILSNQPNNYLVNLKYAEILFSIASGESLDTLILARKYFSHALTLMDAEKQNKNSRALWGLLQTCKAIESISKKEDTKNSEVMKVCQEKIRQMYSKSNINVN